jgi:hypothetical protein
MSSIHCTIETSDKIPEAYAEGLRTSLLTAANEVILAIFKEQPSSSCSSDTVHLKISSEPYLYLSIRHSAITPELYAIFLKAAASILQKYTPADIRRVEIFFRIR